jgi:hypothetical protein
MVLTNHLNLKKKVCIYSSNYSFVENTDGQHLILKNRIWQSMSGQGTRKRIELVKNKSWRPTARTQESSYSCTAGTDLPEEGKDEDNAYPMMK